MTTERNKKKSVKRFLHIVPTGMTLCNIQRVVCFLLFMRMTLFTIYTYKRSERRARASSSSLLKFQEESRKKSSFFHFSCCYSRFDHFLCRSCLLLFEQDDEQRKKIVQNRNNRHISRVNETKEVETTNKTIFFRLLLHFFWLNKS